MATDTTILALGLLLSVVTTVLVALLRLRTRRTGATQPAIKPHPSRVEPKWAELLKELSRVDGLCKAIETSMQAIQPEKAKPDESPSAARLASFIECFHRWEVAVRQSAQPPAVYEAILKASMEKLASTLVKLRLSKLSPAERQAASEADDVVHEATRKALQLSDRDLDRNQTIRALQKPLGDLISCSGLELIWPRPNDFYRPRPDSPMIRVGKLHARGLKTARGKVLLEPEVEEFR
jgi:hypothetical protein